MDGNISALCAISSTTGKLKDLVLLVRNCSANTKGGACIDCSDHFLALQRTYLEAEAAAEGDLCFDVKDTVIFIPSLRLCGAGVY